MNTPVPSLPPLVLIAGPTASGKSALALAIAEAQDGVVINADSAQVYRDLRVVSARPSATDERRAPHRLYGYRDGAEPCSAADWAADARAAIAEAHTAGKIPILTGGTGLYLRTLIDGIAPVPDIDPAVRSAVRNMALATAFAALSVEDPGAAARLRPTDSSRIARALEVVRSTGRPLTHWQQQRSGALAGTVSLAPLVLLPPRPWLHARCDRRFAEIVAGDGPDEVRALLARRLDPSLPVMRAIGVAELAHLIAGTLDRDSAVAAGQTATRQYAKRQYTWFSRQPPREWPRLTAPLDTGRDFAEAAALVVPR